MKQAIIDMQDFNRMIRQLRKVIKDHSFEIRGKLIYLEVKKRMMKCVATDGHRLHEVNICVNADDEFSCYISVPRLNAIGDVLLSLENGYAYVEFADVRFSTKQPQEKLQQFDFDKIRKMIADDERIEIAVNPKYLIDALQALSDEKCVIINIGKDPMKPVVVRANDQSNTQLFGVLPVRSLNLGREF